MDLATATAAWAVSTSKATRISCWAFAANTELGASDYAAIARAFGCHGERVADRAALRHAISGALAHDGPALIDVVIDPIGGRIRKQDPLLGMILFEDIAKSH